MAVKVDTITANYIQVWILEIQKIINITSDTRSRAHSNVIWNVDPNITSCVHLKSEVINTGNSDCSSCIVVH